MAIYEKWFGFLRLSKTAMAGVAVAVALGATLAAGCGDDGCEEGDTRSCSGPDDCSGGQYCTEDGTWSDCDCADGTFGSDGAPSGSGEMPSDFAGSWFACADEDCDAIAMVDAIGFLLRSDGQLITLNWLYGSGDLRGEWAYCRDNVLGTWAINGDVLDVVLEGGGMSFQIPYEFAGKHMRISAAPLGLSHAAFRRVDDEHDGGDCGVACDELSDRAQALLDKAIAPILDSQPACTDATDCMRMAGYLQCQARMSETAAHSAVSPQVDAALDEIDEQWCAHYENACPEPAGPMGTAAPTRELLCDNGSCAFGDIVGY